MNDPKDKSTVTLDLLRKFGGKWAVLMAMRSDMGKRGIVFPPEVNEHLQTSRTKIASGCFSPCEVSCALAEVESRIFSQCHRMSDEEFMKWSDLLAEAMQGNLNYQRILGIRALEPVKNDCGFLECTCS